MTREHREPVGHGILVELLDGRARGRERAEHLALPGPNDS